MAVPWSVWDIWKLSNSLRGEETQKPSTEKALGSRQIASLRSLSCVSLLSPKFGSTKKRATVEPGRCKSPKQAQVKRTYNPSPGQGLHPKNCEKPRHPQVAAATQWLNTITAIHPQGISVSFGILKAPEKRQSKSISLTFQGKTLLCSQGRPTDLRFPFRSVLFRHPHLNKFYIFLFSAERAPSADGMTLCACFSPNNKAWNRYFQKLLRKNTFLVFVHVVRLVPFQSGQANNLANKST